MAPKRGAAPSDVDNETERIVIDRWDASAVKNTLDDAAKDFLISKNVEEDNKYADFRLVMAVAACVFAVVALVMDYFFPYPKSHYMLMGCAGLYFVLMGLQTVFLILFQKNYFFFGTSPSGKGVTLKWKLASELHRIDNEYKLEVTCVDGRQDAPRMAYMTKPFSGFFDTDGTFEESIFSKEMKVVFADLSASRKQD